jgi:SulP family sulfate permease
LCQPLLHTFAITVQVFHVKDIYHTFAITEPDRKTETKPAVDKSTDSKGGDVKMKASVYGLINSVSLLPVMFSFATIIFADPIFQPQITTLIKLVLFSSIVHQIVFTSLSSLNFAVGQVQDAGLIFLSKMSTDIVNSMQKEGKGPEEIYTTVLYTLTLSTALLGIALILTGVFKMANLVQYLPLPVVGGYLAYIGIIVFVFIYIYIYIYIYICII